MDGWTRSKERNIKRDIGWHMIILKAKFSEMLNYDAGNLPNIDDHVVCDEPFPL